MRFHSELRRSRFPLTHEEIVELRKRKYERLMKQDEKVIELSCLFEFAIYMRGFHSFVTSDI